MKLAVCRLFGAYTKFILNPHKPEVGSSSLPRDTIDVLLIDTLTALFAVFPFFKFSKSMVHFLKKVVQFLRIALFYTMLSMNLLLFLLIGKILSQDE